MKKYLTLFLILFLGINKKANAEVIVPEMSDIVYDYEMTCSSNNCYDCFGTLTITVKVPENTNHLYFYNTSTRNSDRYTDADIDKLFFSVLTELTQLPEHGQPKTYSFDKIRWGIYFKFTCTDEDNNRISSEILCSSSFMNPDDLKIILDSRSNMDEVSNYAPNIFMQDRLLIVESEKSLDLYIFTLDGKQIYKNHGISTSEIDLSDVPSQLLLIKYATSDTVKTKKILLK